jgi:antitoxin component YwqK of YwqJK toxin-antitoxin module
LPSQEWEARGKSGVIAHTLKSGVVIREQYDDGQLHGQTTCTFPHSDLIETTRVYDRGVLREECAYSRSGTPLVRTDYHEDNGCSVAKWYENGSACSLEHYDSNKKLRQGMYYTIDHKQEAAISEGAGERPVRDCYGQLLWRDKVHGGDVSERTTYHPNGIPKEIMAWESGLQHGKTKRFSPSGEPVADEQWRQGQKEGIAVEYQNGEKSAEVPYAAGKKEGVEQRFQEGRLVEEISWKDDMRHGQCFVHINGNKFAEWYYKDAPVTKSAFLQLNGQ